MSLLAALQFLTRVPIRLRREPSLAKTVAWFPVAGAIIGAAVGGVAAGMWHLTSPLVAAAIAVAVGLLITGAFHEDGLGDVADAFGGGWTIERRLEILKDSRHGTYGVAAICASIVVRTVSLGALPGPMDMFAAAVAAHTMARVAAVGMAGTMKLATNTGLGADYGRSSTPLRAGVGCVAGIAITTLSVGWWVAPLVGAAAVAAVGTGLLARRKIGGISGDVLGAAEQVAECLCLVVLSGLALHHG
ncbi:MAG: adenosylcobinamide-GDP ribazoletransferase [Ilumatobacteraceae bacterium]|nr:adenosylcobinamide-GDP ribazoletransferase [Ilumatobacteraceae bacterium]